MTSTRAVIAMVAAAGTLLLAACGGNDAGADDPVASTPSESPAGTVTPTEPSAVPTSALAPTTAVPAAPGSTAPPANSTTTTVVVPPPAATAPATPRAAGGAIDSRSPEQIVAESGDRGQRYLAALRAAGIPPTGMDAAEVLYAEGTCAALARGDSRPSVLAEFDSVGQAYAQFLPMPADRVAEIYVGTAETTYC